MITPQIPNYTPELGLDNTSPFSQFKNPIVQPTSQPSIQRPNITPAYTPVPSPIPSDNPFESFHKKTDIQQVHKNMFSDEIEPYNKMISDGISDKDARNMINQRRTDLLWGSSNLSNEELNAMHSMRADWLSAEETANMIKQYRTDKNNTPPPTFTDLHPNEWVVEQTALGIPRAIGDTVSQVWQWIWKWTQWAINLWFRGANALNQAVWSQDYDPNLSQNINQSTNSQWVVGDLSKIGAGTTGAIFNAWKAPLALWLNLANELPWTQYVTQWIGKVINAVAEWAGNIVWLNPETSHDIASTGMNILGMKWPGANTLEYWKNIKSAYAGIENLNWGWILPAVWEALKEPVTAVKDIVTMPLKAWQAIWELAGKARETIAGLKDTELKALANTNKSDFENMLWQAKEALGNDYAQTPYHEGAQIAKQADSAMQNRLSDSQNQRMETIKNSWVEKINTDDVRSNITTDLQKTFNIGGIDKKGNVIPTPWRELLIDPSNAKDMQAIKLISDLSTDTTPLAMMDRIKNLQNLAYEKQWPFGDYSLSKTVQPFIVRAIGKLNENLKSQLPKEYKNIVEGMSEDIKTKQNLEKLFGIQWDNLSWNRWELAMKRLANWTTTSGEARRIAIQIKDATGIDLIKEARLRQLAMDIVGDQRANTLFNVIEWWKLWIVKAIASYARDKIPVVNLLWKEKTALARTKNPDIMSENNNQNNAWNNTSYNSSIHNNNKSNNNSTDIVVRPSNSMNINGNQMVPRENNMVNWKNIQTKITPKKTDIAPNIKPRK